MLKQLSCFQFQRASLSDSSHISAKHGIVLFGPVPKYLWGEIYNRVLSSASLFLWSLHSGELAPQFGMVSSVLLKASFCRWGATLFLIACFTTKLTFSHLGQPSCFANLQVTIALEPLAFPSLWACLAADIWRVTWGGRGSCVLSLHQGRRIQNLARSLWGQYLLFRTCLAQWNTTARCVAKLQEHPGNCLTSFKHLSQQWMWKMVRGRTVSCFQTLHFLWSVSPVNS